MISSFLLSLREGIEAALILAMLFGVFTRLGRRDLAPAAIWGASIAAVLSLAAALALRFTGAAFEEPGEQIFEGFAMIFAAGLLTWMIFWMQRQARGMRSSLEQQVKQNLTRGKLPIFWLAFLSVLREGIELAIFLLAAGLASDPSASFTGAAAGLATAALAGVVIFSSSRRLPLHSFFKVSNVLLLLVAAGLLAHGVHEFNEVAWIPAVIDPLYDINHLLPETSAAGSLLKAMFGYNGNPSLTETLAYLAYLGALVLSLAARQRPISEKASVQG